MKRAQRWLSLALTALLAIASVTVMQTPVQAAGATCPTTAYLPDTNSFPTNRRASLDATDYLKSNNIYYKVNKVSGEAIAVGYDRSYTGALTVPENLTISATEIQIAGFDSLSPNCAAFAKTYKVRYVGPDAFGAVYNETAPVVSSITIDANLKSIGAYAFNAQCLVETIVIPDSVTDIGDGALSGMDSSFGNIDNASCASPANAGLKTVTLGVNLKRLYGQLFTSSQRLTSITLRGQVFSNAVDSYPDEYDLWNVAGENIYIGRAQANNNCSPNFSYVFNLTMNILANSTNDWRPWAETNSCFTPAQVTAFAANVSTPPAKPAAPFATNATQTSADVAFSTDSSDGGSAITSYVVTSVPGGLTATLSGPTGGTVTVQGLAPATSYRFQVAAINANGTSTSSELSNVVTTSLLTAPDITLSNITESATAGSAITGYTITNAGGPVASYSISPAAGNGLSFNSATGALTGTPAAAAIAQAYVITASNGAGTSNATFTLTVAAAPAPAPPAPPTPAYQEPRPTPTPVILIPSAPTALVADVELHAASLTWVVSEGATSQKLYLGDGLVAILAADKSSFALTELDKNTKYVVSLISSNSAGDSKRTTISFMTDNLVSLVIQFAGDSALISKGQRARFDAFIAKVPNLATAQARIVGSVKKTPHATAAFDRKLASARARVILGGLSAKGFPAGRATLATLPPRKQIDSERKAVLELIYDQN